MYGRDFTRRLVAKRYPAKVESFSTAELWGIVLENGRAGSVAYHYLSDCGVTELSDEQRLAHALRQLPSIHEGRGGQLVAALVASQRTLRRIQSGVIVPADRVLEAEAA